MDFDTDWNNTDVTVIFSATDTLSGVAAVTEPVVVTTEGANQYIGAEAVDFADNKATTYASLNIDKTPPSVLIVSPTEGAEYFYDEEIPLSLEVTDALSGLNSYQLSLDGQELGHPQSIRPGLGKHTLEVKAEDNADNITTRQTTFEVKLHAQLKIKPEVFLLKKHGILLAFVKFPSGYDVRTITDAVCEGAPAVRMRYIPGIKQMLLIFRKEDITEDPIDTHFTLRGHFADGYLFEGEDDIRRVITKLKGETS